MRIGALPKRWCSILQQLAPGALCWGTASSFGRANERLALGALQKLAQSSASYSQRLRNQHCQQQGRSLRVWTAASTLKTRRLLSSVLHAASCAALNFEQDFANTLADIRLQQASSSNALPLRATPPGRCRLVQERTTGEQRQRATAVCTASKCQPSSPATTRTRA